VLRLRCRMVGPTAINTHRNLEERPSQQRDLPSGPRKNNKASEMAQNKTGFDPTQTAEYWLEKDVYTVPLQSRSKRPKTKNWPHLRLVEEDLKAGAFKVGDNIGALWGEPSAHATSPMVEVAKSTPTISTASRARRPRSGRSQSWAPSSRSGPQEPSQLSHHHATLRVVFILCMTTLSSYP
jgi:hypothetical protein